VKGSERRRWDIPKPDAHRHANEQEQRKRARSKSVNDKTLCGLRDAVSVSCFRSATVPERVGALWQRTDIELSAARLTQQVDW
jgi:hypothetical protein